MWYVNPSDFTMEEIIQTNFILTMWYVNYEYIEKVTGINNS